MKKLIICLLITLTGLLGQNALAQGILLDGGTALSDTQTQQYLKDICGATGSGTSWNISNTAPNVGVGTVYFVDVNDYWKGLNNNTYDAYGQISKGVKKITVVSEDSKQTTTSGTFYTHPATDANKFFFIVRASSRKGRNNMAFDWYDEWSYVTETSVSGSAGWDALEPTWDMLMDGTPFPSPHNCDTSLETNHYIALDGKNPADREGHDFTAYLYIPEKCKDGTEPKVTYEEVTVKEYQYVSSGTTYYIYDSSEINYQEYNWGWKDKTVTLTSVSEGLGDDVYCDNGSGEYVKIKELYADKYYTTTNYDNSWGGLRNPSPAPIKTVPAYKYQEVTKTKKVVKDGECPYVFFYAVGLNGALGAKQTSAQYNPYTVNLDWSTAFDKFATNGVQQHASYDGGGDASKGMQEHYLVERSYDNTKWETVTDKIVVTGNDVKEKTNKKTVDNQLKPFNETTQLIGYTVYYRVTSYVEKSDGTRMSATTSNTVRVDIPGRVPFKLTLAGEGSSVYNPADVTLNNVIVGGNAYVGPTNSFTNTIISAASTVEEADKVELTDDAVLYLYAVDAKGNTYGEPLYTAENPKGNKSLDVLAKLIDNTPGDDKEGYFYHTMELPAGDSNAAAYQLKLVTGGTETFSNILRISNPAISNVSAIAHRSGYPDEATCVTDNEGKEVFHNEIKFSAAAKEIGTGYYIYRDGVKVMQLNYTESGFRVDGTETYYQPSESDGTVSISEVYEQSPIAIGEENKLNNGSTNDPASWGYSIAYYDGKGNTYGSQRNYATYNGLITELAVGLTVDLRAFLVTSSNDFYVQATLTWNPSKSTYSDAVPAAEEAYDVYVSIEDTHNDDAKNDTPSTNGFVKWEKAGSLNGESTTTTFTDIYTSKHQMEEGRYTKPDRMLEVLKSYKFYVKMKTTEGGIKNSAVVTPTAQAGANGIYTALGDIEAADMDVKVVNGVVEVNGVTGAIKVVNAAGALVAEAEGNGDVTEIAGLTTGVYVVTAPNMKPTKILIK